MPTQILGVLIVDDDDIDAEVLRRLLRPFRDRFSVTRAIDAAQALSILCGEHGFERLPRPYLILLDLYLPGKSGLEFLQQLRQDPELKPSTVYVLGSAYLEVEKVAAYELHVAGYIAKEKLRENPTGLIRLLDSYRQLVDVLPMD